MNYHLSFSLTLLLLYLFKYLLHCFVRVLHRHFHNLEMPQFVIHLLLGLSDSFLNKLWQAFYEVSGWIPQHIAKLAVARNIKVHLFLNLLDHFIY